MSATRAWLELARPFTLLAPAIGMVSGALAASGAVARGLVQPIATDHLAARIAAGAAMAATLNAASNALNQVTDLDADRINKPTRPIPAGRISSRAAVRASLAGYLLAGIAAWALGPACFAAVVGGAVCTLAYSVPPLRLKRFGWLANGTIAMSRGLLLTIAGWTTVASARAADPWWLGGVMALFLLGAASTKDFSDVEGDRASGVSTLPVSYGIPGTIQRIRHAFIWPFLMLPVGVWCGALGGDGATLTAAGLVLAAIGHTIVRSLERAPGAMDGSGNHVTWRRMYGSMLFMQAAVACAYLLPAWPEL